MTISAFGQGTGTPQFSGFWAALSHLKVLNIRDISVLSDPPRDLGVSAFIWISGIAESDGSKPSDIIHDPIGRGNAEISQRIAEDKEASLHVVTEAEGGVNGFCE